jgi:hypothetical protein
MNRNFEEHLYIPIGAGNMLEPGKPDQGQPTYYFPRRNMHVFRVTVPKTSKERARLDHHGQRRTEKVHGCFKPEFILTPGALPAIIGFDVRKRKTTSRLSFVSRGVPAADGDRRGAAPPSATASDDGFLRRARPRRAVPGDGIGAAGRARLSRTGARWYVRSRACLGCTRTSSVARPDARVVAPKIPADGKFPVRVTFRAAGTFTRAGARWRRDTATRTHLVVVSLVPCGDRLVIGPIPCEREPSPGVNGA